MDQMLAMRVFMRVVEAGTFTKAADSMAIPKPTVTKLIQGLESHLRVKLLNRTTRRVTVTPDGATYYESLARLLAEMDDLESGLAHALASPKGKIRVDVGGTVASLILIPALPQFYALYPDIQIELGVTDRQVDLISDNVDCVIRGGALTDLSLVARRVGTLSFVTCATPAYLKTHGLPKDPHALKARFPVASYFSARTGRITPLHYERNGEVVEIEGRHVLAVNESNAHVAAGLAGLGVMQTVNFMVKPHIASGALQVVLADWQQPTVPVHVVYPPNRHLSAKVRVFVDWVAALFTRLEE
ncbi:LysR family transcriptional regulator [Rhodoferax saidenbachensis]|uniref:LysR family transcriptional regulator n=1 Tax=Rhodoferax saidenbachensis TaxID=1484693 RepID=A0A1P8KAT2_9BURK|nr:LysR family transcriptional regulator [Rhodoferax saidenbachensis]APW43114.1 LysR family transcriptional regulator [Rhodoferax saidenbachensis]